MGFIEQVDPAAVRAVPKIGGSPNEIGDAGEQHRPGAHAAGLDGAIEGSVCEAPVIFSGFGRGDADHFGVRGGVFKHLHLIVASCDNAPFLDDDGADGYFIFLKRFPSFFQRLEHEALVVVFWCDLDRKCHSVSIVKHLSYFCQKMRVSGMIGPMWKINTSNPGKLAEFQRLFAAHGHLLEASSIDLPEIDADPLTVAVHKASQAGDGVIVEDTSLEIEGGGCGIHIRWLLAHLSECIGKKAKWRVLLAMQKETSVFVYQGVVKGLIAAPQGEGGFGFDPYFLPEGKAKTLAEEKLDEVNARALAVEAFFQNRPIAVKKPIKDWQGKWQ